MEYEGFKRSIDFLSLKKINIGTMSTDRHTKTSEHMRANCPTINHYFDLLHLMKSMLVSLYLFIGPLYWAYT